MNALIDTAIQTLRFEQWVFALVLLVEFAMGFAAGRKTRRT